MKTAKTRIHRGKQRATNNKRSKVVISAATMGRALAILTSCAAFQPSPITCPAGIAAVDSGLIRSRDLHCTVAMQYRYGADDDQLAVRMQAANDGIVETTDRQSSWRLVSLLQLSFRTARPVDDQQTVMDEYLEYVDRRYSRIHQKTAGSSSPLRLRDVPDFQLPRKIFSTFSLLNQRGQKASAAAAAPPSTTVAAMCPQALAELNALGLSDLASARLRQRLQAPRDLRDEFSAASYFLDHLPSPSFEAALTAYIQGKERATSAPAAVVIDSPTALATSSAVGGRVSSFANVGPIAQFQLMVQTLRKFPQAFVTTVKIIPDILEKGGFRRSVRMVSLATVAVLLIFKPLFRGALKG